MRETVYENHRENRSKDSNIKLMEIHRWIKKHYGTALEFEITPYLGTIRGLEIRSYLEQYEDTHKNEEVELYCIIDDETDMLYEQKDNFVNTNINFGLTDEDADKVINILKNNKR